MGSEWHEHHLKNQAEQAAREQQQMWQDQARQQADQDAASARQREFYDGQARQQAEAGRRSTEEMIRRSNMGPPGPALTVNARLVRGAIFLAVVVAGFLWVTLYSRDFLAGRVTEVAPLPDNGIRPTIYPPRAPDPLKRY